MSLDSATFPLVWMRQPTAEQPHDTAAEFAEFSRLLQREQPFVLLCDRRMDDDGKHDRDERTQIALWKRDHREALARWVKGMVLIEPDDVRRQAAEGLDSYTPSDSWAPYVELSANYQIKKDWDAFFMGRYIRLASEVKDSPMVDKSYTGVLMTGVKYSF